MPAPKSVIERIQLFRDNYDDYTASNYTELRLRREFLDPFFEALGWDISNKAGFAEAYKDVIHEDSIRIAGANNAPDYAFRVGIARKFFVEAKAPASNLKDDDASALQLRRYGWSAKLPLSVLTNFREFAVYDCRFKPHRGDRASTARIIYHTLDEYDDRWDEIESIFSRTATLKGAFDRYAEDDNRKRGTAEVDQEFLADIESWREALARNFALRNPALTVRELNSAVQLTIDRIIFLRIAEDRGIEPPNRLQALVHGKDAYQRLGRLFLQADDRYNSGLFHFSKDDGSAESLDTLNLKLDDSVLRKILGGLYAPESPYEFSVLPANILGQVYEQFLGKVIRLTARSAVIDEKPEVKKAGGVYYTPLHIVQYIVENTLAPLVAGKSPLEIGGSAKRQETSSPLRILDPACGSGAFLIEAYQFMLDWYREQYIIQGIERHCRGKQAALYQSAGGDWRLTIAERRRILLSHIFGVDIDNRAVEVTKLALLLKVLEGESSDAIASQMSLFQVRALPDLGSNIRSGNSLVGTDALKDFFDDSLEPSEIDRNNPFDWKSNFSFMKDGECFDAIVGNPPYIDSEWMTKHWPHERRYCTENYPYAKGNWDIFCVFIGKSVDLLNANGRLSLVVPNKLMTASYAAATRRHLLKNGAISQIRDYAAIKVFPVAVYPIVFSFTKFSKARNTIYEKMSYRNGVVVADKELTVDLAKSNPSGEEWQFDVSEEEMFSGSHLVKLGKIATINDAATVAEAYTLAALLTDARKPAKRDLIFVNSGTIDPYVSQWGIRPTRYIRRAYQAPVLKYNNFKDYGAERIRQATSRKILVANMTKRLEAFYDHAGTVLAGKSVNVIQTEYDPYVLTAILNSDLMAGYYDRRFHGKKLAGGYLQVSPANLREIPVPKFVEAGTSKLFSELVCRLIDEKARALQARDQHGRTTTSRPIDNALAEINLAVRALYQPA
jgi:type I restriction-modification system DNA methylase subunit